MNKLTPAGRVKPRPTATTSVDTTATATPASAWAGGVPPAAMALTFVARVVSGNPLNGYLLDAGAAPCRAMRAAGCLIEPAVGDRVACWRVAGDATDEEGMAYVVTVLERAQAETPARLSVAGDMEIAPIAGRVTVRSEQGVAVEAPRCDVSVETLQVRAQSASLVARTVEAIGEICAATFGELRQVGKLWSTVFDRESHHAQSHHRQVDGLDRLEAQVVDHHAGDLMHLQGENLLVNGDRLVKVRGTQIHFG